MKGFWGVLSSGFGMRLWVWMSGLGFALLGCNRLIIRLLWAIIQRILGTYIQGTNPTDLTTNPSNKAVARA